MASQNVHLLLVSLVSLFSSYLTTTSSQPTISISPKTLTKSNPTLQIQWSGIVPSPADLDWVGIYSPSTSRDKDFIGYLYLNASATYQSGSGSISIPLTNLRSDYQFRIFRWARDEVSYRHVDHDGNPLPIPRTKYKLAVSDPVEFSNKSGPDQVHLAFADAEDEMRVVFVSGDGRSDYVVRYGREEGRLEKEVGTQVRRYERKDMCDWPANATIGWRDPGFAHHGVMKDLDKGKRYFYKVGSDLGGWSDTYSFVSRDSDSNETIAFLFGDMGTYTPYRTFYRTQDESKLTVKWILHEIEALGDRPAFVSHIGDISYARGSAWIWDEFFNQIEPIASTIPYHVCIGNHEYDWPLQPWKPWWSSGIYGKDGGGECGIPYSVRFKMPGNSSLPTGTGAPDTSNLYYSFDAGVVHFLYISTETDFLKGSAQYNFIKSDLESVNRTRTPFIVVQGHRPMYTTSNEVRDTPIRERMLEHLEPLLVENNVTLALWGHVHRYERFCPVKNFKCMNMSSSFDYGGAPVHVVIGMGGQDWQPIWEPRSDHQDVPIFPQPERSMYRGGEFGYTKLVATREKLTLLYVGNHDGQIHDMVEIFSGHRSSNTIDRLSGTSNSSCGDVKVLAEPKSSWSYVKGAGVMMFAVLLGFALGFLIRGNRDSAQHPKWAPVKTEEMSELNEWAPVKTKEMSELSE